MLSTKIYPALAVLTLQSQDEAADYGVLREKLSRGFRLGYESWYRLLDQAEEAPERLKLIQNGYRGPALKSLMQNLFKRFLLIKLWRFT